MTGLFNYIVTYSTAIEAFLVVFGALIAGFLAKFFLNKAARQAEKTKIIGTTQLFKLEEDPFLGVSG